MLNSSYVEAFQEYLVNEKKSSANTISSYMSDINQFVSYVDDELHWHDKIETILCQYDNVEIDKKIYNVKNRKLKAEFICEKSNSKFIALTGNTINNLDIKYRMNSFCKLCVSTDFISDLSFECFPFLF